MFKVSWLLDFLLGPKFYFDTGGSKTPDKTTQIMELPEWARGYAKDTLAKASALTDINENPYQEYGGQRIAGFDPMQQQSFQGAANMQPSQQVGLGSGIAGAAGLGALNTNYQGGQFQGGQFNNRSAQQYMNPYNQNVVDYQKSQAIRDFQVAQPGRNAQAVGAGAFGGSRQAIVDAEAQRNLSSQLQGIEATGQQQAYQNAQQQFNADQTRRLQAQGMGESSRQYGADLGMKGLSTGLQAASTLGQLGQTQYGQEMGINALQNQYGAQQQQQAQRGLDTGYQDFLNQQNYPYKQLGFMSDMVRGLPLGQQSTASIYSQGPSAVQTIAGLGGAAYGFGNSGMFGGTPSSGGTPGKPNKEGGLMESYADGGVTSDQNVESILTKLSDQQLAQAKEAALNRRDMQEAQMIDAEMAERASIRGGMGSAFNQIPQDRQEAMMAGGGMVAFAPGGVAKGGSYLDKMQEAQQRQMNYINQATTPQTPEQQKTNVLAQRNVMKDMYEPSVIPQYLEEVKAERAALSEKMESDKGLAFAMASLKLLSRNKKPGENQTSQFVSGLGEAGEAFAGEVGRLKKEHREANRLLRQSELQLATAHQLHEDGMTDRSVAKADQAQALIAKAAELNAGVAGDTVKIMGQLEGTKLGADAQKYAADVGYKGHLASAAATMNKLSPQMEGVKIKADDIRRRNPNMPESQVRDQALTEYNAQTKTGMPGVDARTGATAREKATKEFLDATGAGGKYSKELRELKKSGTPDQVKARENQIYRDILAMHMGDEDLAAPAGQQPAPAGQQPAPAAQASPANPADRQAMLWATDPKNANDPRLPAIKARLGLK